MIFAELIPNDKLAYAYRMKKLIINDLNALIGTDAYKAHRVNIFMPRIKAANTLINSCRKNATIGIIAPNKEVLVKDTSYITERTLMESAAVYDVELVKAEIWSKI